MLGDTAEKSKNPLKKAMRRRNARTVQINTQPIYVEASDYEYSSDEGEEDDESFANGGAVQEQQAAQQADEDEVSQVDPQASGRQESAETNGEMQVNGRADEVDSRRSGDSQPRPSEESVIDKQCKHETNDGT